MYCLYWIKALVLCQIASGCTNSIGIWGGDNRFAGQIENNLVYVNTNQGLVLRAGPVRHPGRQQHGLPGSGRRRPGGERLENVLLRNNILWVESGYAIHINANSLQGFDSDYNLVHQGADPNPHYGRFGGTIHDTLLEWQSATGLGGYSLEGTPLFVDPNGADNIFGFDASGDGLDGGETTISNLQPDRLASTGRTAGPQQGLISRDWPVLTTEGYQIGGRTTITNTIKG